MKQINPVYYFFMMFGIIMFMFSLWVIFFEVGMTTIIIIFGGLVVVLLLGTVSILKDGSIANNTTGTISCPKCGKSIPDDQAVCPHCKS